jgi:hypothetical protein
LEKEKLTVSSAVFSDQIARRYIPANVNESDIAPHRPWQVSVCVSDDEVTVLLDRHEWLLAAFKNLARMGALRMDWDSYGAEAPSNSAIEVSRSVLKILAESEFEPASIDPSAEGGVCLSFRRGDRYGDIECFNSGAILAVTSTGGDETNVWEIVAGGPAAAAVDQSKLKRSIQQSLRRIRSFILG